MSVITRSNLVLPEILMDAIKGAFSGMKIFAGNPACVINGSLPGTGRGGDTVKIPLFGTLGEMQDVAEGTPLVPAALTMSSETEAIQHSGLAFEMTQWAQMAAAFADPYGEAARQVVEAVERRADKALIDACVANGLPAGQVVDVFNATTPKTLDYPTVVKARMGFGDEQGDIALLAVHSKVYGDLLTLVDGFGRPLLTTATDSDVSRIAGIPVKMTDRLPCDLTNMTAAGTTPPTAPTISGAAVPGVIALKVRISTGGSLGTAQFQFSTDGGTTYSTAAATGAGPIALGSTGLSASFVSGSYTNDNVYTSVPKFTSVVLKKGAVVFWYNGNPSAELFRDVLLDAEIAATHVYWVAHRYSRLPGFTKPGVALIKTN